MQVHRATGWTIGKSSAFVRRHMPEVKQLLSMMGRKPSRTAIAGEMVALAAQDMPTEPDKPERVGVYRAGDDWPTPKLRSLLRYTDVNASLGTIGDLVAAPRRRRLVAPERKAPAPDE